jgi:Protein of unknown function (DUF3341)
MKALYAMYAEPEAAQSALDSLRAADLNLGPGKIVVISGEPHEGYAFTDEHATGNPYRWAVLGAVVGGTTGYLLTTLSQKSYPIITGGMPLSPAWTNGIIVYEMIMLGAILTTLVVLLVGAGLPNFKGVLTDPEVASGKILVGVIDPPESAQSELEKRLLQAGASQVKRS